MVKYKCNKCRNIVNGKSNIPLEHGKMSLVFFPDKSTSSKCEGVYYEEKEDD